MTNTLISTSHPVSGTLSRVNRQPGFVLGSTKPNSVNTGVLPGSTLTPMHQDYTITTAGTTLTNLDIYGRIVVKAANVTIRNCRIRGNTDVNGMVIAWDAAVSNLLVENCTLIPDLPYRYDSTTPTYIVQDGISGHDYTARRCEIAAVCDGFTVFNTSAPNAAVNVNIEGCYVHDHAFITPDSAHSDAHSHNDGVQIQGGTNITIRGNNFESFASSSPSASVPGAFTAAYLPQTNSCIQIKMDVGTIAGVIIDKNWFDGGQSSLNIAGTTYVGFGSITNNRFGRNQRVQFSGTTDTACLLINSNNDAVISGNVYEDTKLAITRHNGS